MTKEVITLTDEQGKRLAQAYSDYKLAEANFKLIKKELTEKIDIGKHVTKYAIVNKIAKTRTEVNYKQACEDNQIDLSKYTTVKEQEPTVTIQPLVVDEVETPKKSLLKLF